MEEKHSNLNLKEHSEPAAGNSQMPVSIMVVLTLLGYIGCYKVDELNANFAANVHAPFGSPAEVASLAPSEAELIFGKGKQIYANCQGCHQPNGGGTPGQIPPSVNSSWVKGDPKLAAAIVLNGLQGAIAVNGTPYNGAMTAVGAAWSDEEIAAVLTYIRQSWGNGEELVTADQVAEARTMIKDSGHQGTWNKASLDDAGFATPE